MQNRSHDTSSFSPVALKLSSQAVVSATVLALVAVENKKDLRASVRFSVCVCVRVSVCWLLLFGAQQWAPAQAGLGTPAVPGTRAAV